MKRIVYLDYIRIFACFLVMLVHASEYFYGFIPPELLEDGAAASNLAGPQSYLFSEADRLWVSIYDGFSRIAVPLFMIVSAFLLVPMKEEQTTWEFYKKRFLRVVPPIVAFMLIYSLLPLLWGGMEWSQSANDLKRLLLNFPSMAGHFWFIYPLLGLYLFIPIISPWLRKATAKEELFFIGLFALSTCMPFLNRWVGEVWGQCFWNEYHMLWNFSGYLGYLVLAHYIRVHLNWERSKRFWVGLVAFIVGTFVTIWSFYTQATPGVIHSTPVIEVAWAFCTINCVVATFGAFLLFTCIEQKEAPAIVTDMSKLSFGMYLMHLLWLGFWILVFKEGNFGEQFALPSVAAIPVIAVATFICCYATSKLISYIPGSKWIIG